MINDNKKLKSGKWDQMVDVSPSINEIHSKTGCHIKKIILISHPTISMLQRENWNITKTKATQQKLIWLSV